MWTQLLCETPIPEGWTASSILREPKQGEFVLTLRGTVTMIAVEEYGHHCIILTPDSEEVRQAWSTSPGRPDLWKKQN